MTNDVFRLSFKNNENKITFYEEWVDPPMIRYRDIVSIDLTAETVKKLFSKKTVNKIVIVRKLSSGKTGVGEIIIADDEMDNARIAVSYIRDFIQKKEEQKAAQEAKQHAAAEAERKAAEAKANAIDDNAVPVEDLNGQILKLAWYMVIDDDTSCLVSDGGKTYHTHVGCYKKWLPEYQKDFKGWKAMKISDAEVAGMKKCSFCDEKDSKTSSSSNLLSDWEDYENEKPVKTFTVTDFNEYAVTHDIGDEVEEGYDSEKDRDTITILAGDVAYMPKGVREFFDENPESYKMFVLDSYETDNGKVKIKVGIFEEK